MFLMMGALCPIEAQVSDIIELSEPRNINHMNLCINEFSESITLLKEKRQVIVVLWSCYSTSQHSISFAWSSKIDRFLSCVSFVALGPLAHGHYQKNLQDALSENRALKLGIYYLNTIMSFILESAPLDIGSVVNPIFYGRHTLFYDITIENVF